MNSRDPLGLELHVEQVLVLGAAALKDIQTLGIGLPPGNRLDASIRVIRESIDAPVHTIRAIVDAEQSVIESFIIGRIALASRNVELARKLRSLVRGRVEVRLDANAHPRNEQFEALVWALLTVARLGPVTVAEPDFLVLGPGGPLGVAVKRLGSPDSLERNVIKGLKQISGSSAARGMLAINVDIPYRALTEDEDGYVSTIPPAVEEILARRDPAHCIEVVLVVGARADIGGDGLPTLAYDFSVRVLPVPEPERELVARRIAEIGKRIERHVVGLLGAVIGQGGRAGA